MSIGILRNALTIRRGQRLRRIIRVTGADGLVSWTGYSFQMHFRTEAGAPSTVFALESGDGITVGGTDDTEIVFEVSTTRTMAANACQGVFDLKYWREPDKSDAEFLFSGRFSLEQAVSRDGA